jgi:3-hydroxyisobutyrate dehydrogenase-like beta-hydroxyacid dehydrogenase
MGKNITLVGGNGDGQTAKVANQIIVALNIQAVAEALLFAAKNGADPAKVREALMGGFASSKILEVHGERMIKGTFDPGFRISLHQKDLNLALQGAKELNINLPNTANAQQVFSTCAGHRWQQLGPLGADQRPGAHGQLLDPRRQVIASGPLAKPAPKERRPDSDSC